MEKWLIVGMGQEMHEMSLENPEVPETKKVLRDKSNNTHNDAGMLKGQKGQLKELQVAKSRKIWATKIKQYFVITHSTK